MSAPAERDERAIEAALRLSGQKPNGFDARVVIRLRTALELELSRFLGRPNEWDTWHQVHESLQGVLNRTFKDFVAEGIPAILIRLFEGEPGRVSVTLYEPTRPWMGGITLELVPRQVRSES